MVNQGPIALNMYAHSRQLPDEMSASRLKALELFAHIWRRARLARFRDLLTGRRGGLQSLAAALSGRRRQQQDAGLQVVPVQAIVGSEGRSGDFDREFRPLQAHSRDRWAGIAVAMWQQKPLPPVTLLQLGDRYFVRDGHHRISVARALGQATVDALVVRISG